MPLAWCIIGSDLLDGEDLPDWQRASRYSVDPSHPPMRFYDYERARAEEGTGLTRVHTMEQPDRMFLWRLLCDWIDRDCCGIVAQYTGPVWAPFSSVRSVTFAHGGSKVSATITEVDGGLTPAQLTGWAAHQLTTFGMGLSVVDWSTGRLTPLNLSTCLTVRFGCVPLRAARGNLSSIVFWSRYGGPKSVQTSDLKSIGDGKSCAVPIGRIRV